MDNKIWHMFQLRVDSFFQDAQRLHAKKKPNIRILKPERLMEFLEFIIRSRKVPDTYKLLISLQLTTGSRISEILSLKKKDIRFKGNKAIILIDVLKKRDTPLKRAGAVAPVSLPLLKRYIESLEEEEILFKLSRQAVWKKYKNMFGTNTHALRNSWITHLFEVKGYDVPKVVNTMAFANWRTALQYYNNNPEKQAWDMFDEAA